MVEALGINVRRVFTIVFMIGTGLAALGGIGAAPFIPVESNMGDVFLLQAFIVVVIGGIGSFNGAAIGALLLGLARAFGDYLALRFNLTPAIAEASTIIIMAIVLLASWAGHLIIYGQIFMTSLDASFSRVGQIAGFVVVGIAVLTLAWILLESRTRLQRIGGALVLWYCAISLIYLFRGGLY